jgi:lipoate-protein ligase A
MAINQLLVGALERLGVPATLAEGSHYESIAPRPATDAVPRSNGHAARALGPHPCFDDAVPGEVVALGRKLVGSAQWREGNALLQHGSILIADDQALLARIAPDVRPAPVATVRDYIAADPTADDVARAAAEALDEELTAMGRAPSTISVVDARTRAAAQALQTHYEDDGWTWRR